MPNQSPSLCPPASSTRYRWLIWVLSVRSALLVIAPYLIFVLVTMIAGGMCNGCSVGWREASALLSSPEWMMLGLGALMEILLSVIVYFAYRWIDRPPHRWRPLAVILLLAYLFWPLLGLISAGHAILAQ